MRSINPATGELVAEYADYTDAEVERCVAAAFGVVPRWRALPVAKRAAMVGRVAEVLAARREDLALLMTREMGKPIREARAEVDKCAWVCRYYAEHGVAQLSPESVATDARESFVRFDPLGVVLAVMPWNFPLWQVFRFAAPALTAGNVGLLKHASNVSGCALAIESAFVESGLPPGTFASLLVGGDRVASLIADDRIAAVSLTGSTPAGRAVGAAAGEALKPSVLELGGSDPFIVLADADLEAAVRGAVLGRHINGGQSCIAAKRFIVEASVYDPFVAGLQRAIAALRLGDPESEATDVGPLARADLVGELHAQVEASVRQGARCLLGGQKLPPPGFFYPATLLVDVEPGMTVFEEETFGPVTAVTRVPDAGAAVQHANASRFGLGASLWTTPERGRELAREIESGHVAVNGIVKSDPRLPFGGVKESGYGRELARQGLHAFVNVKSVWVG